MPPLTDASSEGMSRKNYIDIITDMKILELTCERPREVIIEGMLFGVKSQTRGRYEEMLKGGWLTQEEYQEMIEEFKGDVMILDIPTDYFLMEINDLTIQQLKDYLHRYTELLKPHMSKDKIAFVEQKMDELQNYLIHNFLHLQAYTHIASYGDDNASTEGSMVFADTSDPSQSPTFLYLEFGLTAYTDSEFKNVQQLVIDQQHLVNFLGYRETMSELEDKATSSYSSPNRDSCRDSDSVISGEEKKMNKTDCGLMTLFGEMKSCSCFPKFI